MADVLLSNNCLIGAVGTCSIGMLRTELLLRKDEGLFDGYRVFKVVHLKEKTLIGHEFLAVYLRKGNTFIVVRIERRPGSPLGSSSDLWTDDSISRLHSNFDSRNYFHLSTIFCEEQKALTVFGICDICAFIRNAAPFYSVTKKKHCYWFCTAFLIRLSTEGYSTAESLEKGKCYEKRGHFGRKQIITEDYVLQDLAAHASLGQKPHHLLQLSPAQFRSKREQWSLEWEPKGHTEVVYSVCFTPDGKHFLSGSRDCTIRTWDITTGKDARRPLRGHSHPVNSVSISPDGRHFVSGSYVGTLRIWDLEAGTPASEPHNAWRGHVVAWSPDGRTIVSGCLRALHLWDAKTGAAIGDPLLGHTSAVHSVAWSPDGSRIISGSRDETVRMWDAQTGVQIGEPLVGHTSIVRSVCFSPDGSRFVSGSDDGTLRLWNLLAGGTLARPEGELLRGHKGNILSVAFSPDGHWIASGSWDKTVRIQSIKSDGERYETIRLHCGHRVYSVSWSPTGEHIAAGGEVGVVQVWRKAVTRQNLLHRALSALISRIVSFNAYTMQWNLVGKLRNRYSSGVLRFTPDGRYIISTNKCGGAVQKWDVTAMQEGGVLAAPDGHVQSLAVSPDGHHTVSALSTVLTRSSVAVFSPDGSRTVSYSLHDALHIRDAKTGVAIGNPLPVLGHHSGVSSLAWSPDGSHIIGSSDHTIQVWDAQTGVPLGEPLLGHTDRIRSICFSPDGRRIVSGSEDGTLRLWDAASRQPVGEPLRGHTHWVGSVTFSADGRWILSGSWDKTVRIWSIKSGRGDGEVARLDAQWEVHSLACSPAGDMIAAGCIDGDIRVWFKTA